MANRLYPTDIVEQARAVDLANIVTHACAADDLPRDHAPFDSAICRLGLMLMPNPAAVVAAVRDMLRPGGCISGLVMSSPSANPFYVAVPSILRRHANKPAPASGPGFFALADPAVLRAVHRAGLTDGPSRASLRGNFCSIGMTSFLAFTACAMVRTVLASCREAGNDDAARRRVRTAAARYLAGHSPTESAALPDIARRLMRGGDLH